MNSVVRRVAVFASHYGKQYTLRTLPAYLMKHIAARLALTSLLVSTLPLAAFAAFASPGTLLLAAMDDTSPRSMSLEARVHIPQDDTYVSLWIKGEQEAQNDMAAMKAKGVIAVDVHSMQNGAVVDAKLRTEYRVARGMLYVKLTNLEGTLDNPLTVFGANMKLKDWVGMDLQQLADDGVNLAALQSDPETRSMMLESLDAMLSMTSTKTPSGMSYALQLNPESSTDVRRAFEGIDLSIKEDTNANDEFRFLRFSVTATSDSFELNVNGSMTDMPHSVQVEVPTTSRTWEEFAAQMQGSSVSDFESFLPATPDFDPALLQDLLESSSTHSEETNWETGNDDWSDGTSTGDWNTIRDPAYNTGCPAPGTAEFILWSRKGACQLRRPRQTNSESRPSKVTNPRTTRLLNADMEHRVQW